MPDGPNAGQSYEAWIESMAGASPPCDGSEYCQASHHIHGCYQERRWPQPVPPPYEADDEDEATPDE